MKLFIAITTLAFANFLYQFFAGNNWGVALERSYFQALAVLIYHFIFIN